MAFRGFNMAPVGSLLKGTQPKKGKVAPTAEGQRKPRANDAKHLAFIRTLPCISCGNNIASEAAHLRAASLKHGKANPGGAAKPDDRWTTPLCNRCHLDAPNAQHKVGEQAFWGRLGINPFRVCEELFAATGNAEKAEEIIIQARGGAYPPEWD